MEGRDMEHLEMKDEYDSPAIRRNEFSFER